jgi:asparagine synthase (glutamine-hydrolysing)
MGAIAGIYGTGEREAVERALEPEGEPAVRRAGALTLGWVDASEHADGPLLCVAVGDVRAGDAAAVYRDEALNVLRGEFSLAIWDERTGRGVLARDQLGLGGLFFMRTADGIAFATEIRTLLRLVPSRPAPDELAIVHWLANGCDAPGRTFYAGVERLAPGGMLVLQDGWRSERYWTPRYVPAPHMDAREAAAVLGDEVARAVHGATGDGSVGVLLSGGFDSGYVASLAARAVRRPRGYSALFPDHPSVDETSYIERLAGDLGIETCGLAVRADNPFAAAFDYLAEWQVPLPSMGHYYARVLLSHAAQDGVDVLLDGEGGDEAFGFDSHLLADLLASGRLPSAVRLARTLAGEDGSSWRVLADDGLRAGIPYRLHRILRGRRGATRRAPGWLSERSARLLGEVEDPWAWKRLGGPRWWAHRVHRLVDGAEALGVGDYLRRRAREAGVSVAHPLLSVDLIECVLRLPPELALRGGDDRALARLSAAGVMPDSARLRMDKSYFNELYNDCLTRELGFLQRLLLDGGSELRAYVRQDVVRRLLERPPAPDRRARSGWAPLVWRLAAVEMWLRAQADTRYPQTAVAADHA